MSNGSLKKGQTMYGKKRRAFIVFFAFVFLLVTLHASRVTVFAADRHQIMDELKKAVQAELLRSVSEKAELNGIRIMKGLEALDEDKAYAVGGLVMDGYNGRNRIVYLAVLYDDKKIAYKVQVEAAYDVLADIFVAAKPLSSGTIITEDDFYAVKQKNSRLSPGTITDISEIKGRKLRSNIAQGVILRADHFTNVAGIKKGREVIVLVEGSNVMVSTKGVLANDAVVGGFARVFCSSPKKEINGILISADTVKVKI